MAIKANFSVDDVKKRFGVFLNEVEKKEIERLQKLGEKCVTHARNILPPDADKGFNDITGNLRSSIGYVVFNNGVAVHTGYEQVLNGGEGAKKGEALARKVGEKQKGVCLVVTAGMNYALCVEAKGRDVITSAEKMAERELPEELEKLVKNIKKV